MNRKLIVLAVLLSFSMMGFTKASTPSPDEGGDFGLTSDYGVLTFSELPDPETLIETGITSLNYINDRMIYAYVSEVELLESIDGYVSFAALDEAAKLSPMISELYSEEPGAAQMVMVYLPPDFSADEAIDFCTENSLERVESEYLPHFIIGTEINLEQVNELKALTTVSWIMPAPRSLQEGRPFHMCLGRTTPYGHEGEFQAKYNLANTPGWDGPGLGCADITYHFINGTPDIAGTLEHDEVVRALREYEKYIQVNYWETDIAGLINSMDIQWSYSLPSTIVAQGAGPGSMVPISGDIWFNDNKGFDLAADDNTVHLFTTALHEIGHTLGIAHNSIFTSAMYWIFDADRALTGLHPDDIAGIRALYATRNIQEDENDQTFIANVTGDDNMEVVMINTSYNGGAIRVDDVQTGDNLLWINHCNFTGWMDNTDKMFLADANGDGYDDLVLVNTDYVDGAIRVIDLNTGLDYLWVMHGSFGGWMGPNDKMFVGNVDGTPQDELILVNTSYSGGAIMAVDLSTGAIVSTLYHSGSYSGWMDATDRMLIGDANGDEKDDLILINTSYGGGAIRSVDITTGTNWGWLDHTGEYNGWMDEYDKVAVADMNFDMKDELVLVNTSYTGGAVKTISLETGAEQSLIPHGTFGGWMSLCDRMFIADINFDFQEDLILVNTSGSGDAIRAIDLSSGTDLVTWAHGAYAGWMSSPDRMYSEDVNADGYAELVMINSVYAGGAVKSTTILTETHIAELAHTGTFNGWIDGLSSDQNCNAGPVFKTAGGYENSDATMNNQLREEKFVEIEGIKVYPNPATSGVNFEYSSSGGNAQMRVYNLYGQAVTGPIKVQEGVNQIDLSEFTDGTYIIEIIDEERTLHAKVELVR